MLKQKQKTGHQEYNMASLDGKIETWTEGRINKDGKNWLRKYQGKNFDRKPSLISRWIKRRSK